MAVNYTLHVENSLLLYCKIKRRLHLDEYRL